jgi:hypothetical protein
MTKLVKFSSFKISSVGQCIKNDNVSSSFKRKDFQDDSNEISITRRYERCIIVCVTAFTSSPVKVLIQQNGSSIPATKIKGKNANINFVRLVI